MGRAPDGLEVGDLAAPRNAGQRALSRCLFAFPHLVPVLPSVGATTDASTDVRYPRPPSVVKAAWANFTAGKRLTQGAKTRPSKAECGPAAHGSLGYRNGADAVDVRDSRVTERGLAADAIDRRLPLLGRALGNPFTAPIQHRGRSP